MVSFCHVPVDGRTEGGRGCRPFRPPGTGKEAVKTDSWILDFCEFPRFEVEGGKGAVAVFDKDRRLALVFGVVLVSVLRLVLELVDSGLEALPGRRWLLDEGQCRP